MISFIPQNNIDNAPNFCYSVICTRYINTVSTINVLIFIEGGNTGLIKLDLQSRLPIYEQLRSKIIELALLGELKPDDQLPSVRSFARELGVNPNTVQKAYQELERDRIIYSVAGRGSYINPEIDLGQQLGNTYVQKIRQAAKQAKSCGVMEERAVDAVREAYKEGDNHD